MRKTDLQERLVWLEAENKRLESEVLVGKKVGFYNNAGAVFQTLIKWGCGAICFYFLSVSISDLSGKQTNADIKANFSVSANVNGSADSESSESEAGFISGSNLNALLGWLVGVLGVAYGAGQRKIRHSTVRKMADHTAELEKLIDPNRTSSGIEKSGDKRRED